MSLPETVMIDLLTLVRSGQASVETQALVDEWLAKQTQAADLVALSAPPDPSLELKALERTRRALRRAGWEKALALLFTALPCAFVFDEGRVRFLFADYPGLIVGMVVTALAFWARHYRFSRRCGLG